MKLNVLNPISTCGLPSYRVKTCNKDTTREERPVLAFLHDYVQPFNNDKQNNKLQATKFDLLIKVRYIRIIRIVCV